MVAASEGAHIVEIDAVLLHGRIALLPDQVAEVKRLPDHDMVNAVSHTETKAKQLEWHHVPFADDLRFGQQAIDATEIVQGGRDELKAKDP